MKKDKYILNLVAVVVENVSASADKVKALETSLKFFGKEILKLEDEDFRFSIKKLKSELEKAVPEFRVEPSEYAKDKNEITEMDSPTRKLIAHTINAVEGMYPEKRDILISAITDYDEMVKTKIEE
jgi:hypothetical protein